MTKCTNPESCDSVRRQINIENNKVTGYKKCFNTDWTFRQAGQPSEVFVFVYHIEIRPTTNTILHIMSYPLNRGTLQIGKHSQTIFFSIKGSLVRTKLIFPDVYAYICISVDCINRFSIERGVGLFIITFSLWHRG